MSPQSILRSRPWWRAIPKLHAVAAIGIDSTMVSHLTSPVLRGRTATLRTCTKSAVHGPTRPPHQHGERRSHARKKGERENTGHQTQTLQNTVTLKKNKTHTVTAANSHMVPEHHPAMPTPPHVPTNQDHTRRALRRQKTKKKKSIQQSKHPQAHIPDVAAAHFHSARRFPQGSPHGRPPTTYRFQPPLGKHAHIATRAVCVCAPTGDNSANKKHNTAN